MSNISININSREISSILDAIYRWFTKSINKYKVEGILGVICVLSIDKWAYLSIDGKKKLLEIKAIYQLMHLSFDGCM